MNGLVKWSKQLKTDNKCSMTLSFAQINVPQLGINLNKSNIQFYIRQQLMYLAWKGCKEAYACKLVIVWGMHFINTNIGVDLTKASKLSYFKVYGKLYLIKCLTCLIQQTLSHFEKTGILLEHWCWCIILRHSYTLFLVNCNTWTDRLTYRCTRPFP